MTDATDFRARLMTVDEVCDYLGLSRDFVYDQVRYGALRCSRIARQLRFRLADVDAFVDQHTVGSTTYPVRPSEVSGSRSRTSIRRANAS